MTQGSRIAVVLRGGTVLTVDATHRVLPGTDVLVTGDRIAEVGPSLAVPDGHPGDRRLGRHRHAGHDRHPPAHVADRHARLRRRLDAHPVLRLVLPGVGPPLPPRGRARRQPARRAGGRRRGRHHLRRLVARPADHRPRRGRGRRAALGPRPVRARLRQHPAGARGSGRPPPDFRAFARRQLDEDDDLLGFQMAFDVTGDPAFPERAAYEVARELGVPVTTHAGVWGATNDDGIRLAHEAGFLDETSVFVHAATLSADSYHRIAATGGSVSVATESEQSAGQGYPPTLGAARARHPGVAVDGHQRLVERRPVLGDAHHAGRRPLPRAPGGARQGRHGHPPRAARRAGRRVGDPAAAPRPWAASRTSAASRSARRPTSCCSRTTTRRCRSRSSTRYGHVAFQAQRGDVHTVLVDGRVVKSEHRLVDVDLGRRAARGRGDGRSTCAPRSARRRGRRA